jgi:hypothetical protein
MRSGVGALSDPHFPHPLSEVPVAILERGRTPSHPTTPIGPLHPCGPLSPQSQVQTSMDDSALWRFSEILSLRWAGPHSTSHRPGIVILGA